MRRSRLSALAFLLLYAAGIVAPVRAAITAADAGCEQQQTICAHAPGPLAAHTFMAPAAGAVRAVDASGWTPSAPSFPDARFHFPVCTRDASPAAASDEADLHVEQQMAQAATAFSAAPPRAPPIRSRH